MRIKLPFRVLAALFGLGLSISGYGQYTYNWNPEAESVYGDPLEINTASKVIVSIGPSSLPPGTFNLNDVGFRKNEGLWYQGIAAYSPGSEWPYDVKCNTKNFIADTDTIYLEMRIRETGGDYIYADIWYLYSSPMVEIENVLGVAYHPGDPVVLPHLGTSFLVDIRGWAKHGPESQSGGGEEFGDARIGKLEFANNPQFDNFYTRTTAPGYTVNFSLNIFEYYTLENEGLAYGHNTLYFRTTGEGSFEKSPVVELPFFVFDFQVPEEQYCKYDTFIALKGLPAGGRFTVACIVDSTMMFNPFLAEGAGTTEISYEYNYMGENYSISKTVGLFDIPDFTISGNRQVCGYEHGTVYSVISNDPSIHTTWEVAENSYINSRVLSDQSLFIDWGLSGNSWVKAMVENNNACVSEKKYLIYIKQRQAPQDSAYMILNDRMLICSDTNVNYYYWYHANNNQLLGITHDKNFYYIGFQPAQTDSFYVETAYDTLGCVTHSHFSASEGTLKLNTSFEEALSIFPNPTEGEIKFNIPAHPDSDILLRIYDNNGNLVHYEQHPPSLTNLSWETDLGKFNQGIYLVSIYSNSFNLSKKVILAK